MLRPYYLTPDWMKNPCHRFDVDTEGRHGWGKAGHTFDGTARGASGAAAALGMSAGRSRRLSIARMPLARAAPLRVRWARSAGPLTSSNSAACAAHSTAVVNPFLGALFVPTHWHYALHVPSYESRGTQTVFVH